jgi:predicted transposase YbfD/YdcC
LKLSGLAMQGLAPSDDYTFKKCAEYSIKHTTALLNLIYSIKSNTNEQ